MKYSLGLSLNRIHSQLSEDFQEAKDDERGKVVHQDFRCKAGLDLQQFSHFVYRLSLAHRENFWLPLAFAQAPAVCIHPHFSQQHPIQDIPAMLLHPKKWHEDHQERSNSLDAPL